MQVIAVFLQVGLPLLEKPSADSGEILVLVVPVCIGPLQDFPALNDCLAAMLKEIELFRWVILPLVEQNALLLDHWEKFDGELA